MSPLKFIIFFIIINYAYSANDTLDPKDLSEKLKLILAKEKLILKTEKNIIQENIKRDKMLNLTNKALDINIMLSTGLIDKKYEIESYYERINKTMAYMKNTKDYLLNMTESLKNKEKSVKKTLLDIKDEIFILSKLKLINETFNDNETLNKDINMTHCRYLNQRERILHNNQIYFKKEVSDAENFLKNVSTIEARLKQREYELDERDRYMNMALEEANNHIEHANATMEDADEILLEANETLYNVSTLVRKTYIVVATIGKTLDRFTKLNNTLDSYILQKNLYKLNDILDIIDDINNQNNSLLTSMISKNLTTYYRNEYCKHLMIHAANSDYILYIVIVIIFCCSTAIILYLIKIFVYKRIKYTINN